MIQTAIPSMVTIDELAELLHYNKEYLRRLTRQGKIPGARKVIGRWLYDAETITQWIAHGRPDQLAD